MCPINESRVAQSRRDFEAIRADYALWLKDRRAADKARLQFDSQLNELARQMKLGFDALETRLKAIKPADPPGNVFHECRGFSRRLLFVREVWDYYRVRFAQREEKSPYRAILAAADEVVWSCYSEPFDHAGATRAAQPLAFVSGDYSPAARRRDLPPPEFRSDYVPVEGFVSQLPIPLVSLPPTSPEAPWTLVLIGHEIGHHLENDLRPTLDLTAWFDDVLAAAIQASGHTLKPVRTRWQAWAAELLADACSVYCMGVAAVSALAELILADEKRLLTPLDAYPPAAARLAFVARLADLAAVPGGATLAHFQLNPAALTAGSAVLNRKGEDLRKPLAVDLAVAAKLAEAVAATPLEKGGQLKLGGLWAWDAAEMKGVSKESERLREGKPLPVAKGRRDARLRASAAGEAWAEVAREPDAATRDAQRARLIADVPKRILDAAEEITRSGALRPRPNQTATADLGQYILDLPEGPAGQT